MKRLLRFAFVSLCLALAASPGALAQPARATAEGQPARAAHAVPVQRVVSPRGVEAWLVSDNSVPMVVLNARWRGGGAQEDPRLTGVTSVLAEMMTEGSGPLDAAAFHERLEQTHARISYSADADGLNFSLVALSRNADEAFALARSTLIEPRFDAAPLLRIRGQMEVAIRQRETNAGYIANLALDQALYPDHPYARRIELENVRAIDRAALVARRDALLTRQGLQITVVGAIDAATLARRLDALFGDLPDRPPPAPAPQARLRAATPLIVRPLPQPQSVILFAAPGIQDEDPDWIALAVANYILGGGGFSSRLMDEVREQRGLVYGIATGSSVRDGAALIRGSAQTENGDVPEAIGVIRDVMGRLYRDGATQAEVTDAINYLTGSFPLSLDSNVGIAGVLHAYHVSGRSIDYVNQRNALIRAVTLADVNRVIRRLLNPDAFTFVVVGQPAPFEARANAPAQGATPPAAGAR